MGTGPLREQQALLGSNLVLAPLAQGDLGPLPVTPAAPVPADISSLAGADPEETILNAFKVFDPEGKGSLKAD